MKIIVTAYKKNAYLIPNFKLLMGKFLALPYEIDVAPEHERLSNQLSRIIREEDEEYVVLLKEDFYMIAPTDILYLQNCYAYAMAHDADRFSLQQRSDGYMDTSFEYGDICGTKVFRLDHKEKYICSLEASIWKVDFLKKHLFLEGSDRDVELDMSKQVKTYAKVLVPEKRVLTYADALRGGHERIKVIDGNFHLMVQGPSGEDLWKNLNISAE